MIHLLYRIYYPTDVLDSKDLSFTEISKELNTGRRQRISRKVNALCGSLECSILNDDEENEATYASWFQSFVVCDVQKVTSTCYTLVSLSVHWVLKYVCHRVFIMNKLQTVWKSAFCVIKYYIDILDVVFYRQNAKLDIVMLRVTESKFLEFVQALFIVLNHT